MGINHGNVSFSVSLAAVYVSVSLGSFFAFFRPEPSAGPSE
ncbi:hypothetical protein vfu_A00419 [Vibrio furnissii NCTC 11218]|nr:hypothetical protein vfu_A00419 [Vibrio furnissii NCTC 11218]